MNKEYTDISVILDRSGSMADVLDDTIGGFNAFLDDQKTVPGHVTMSLVRFDNEYERVYIAIPLSVAPRLSHANFVPRGSTALLDAIGRTIVETGERLEAMPEADRPGKVIVVILTDGQENSSREYTRERVSDMIRHQKETYSWEFLFLGADQDAIATAATMNIAASHSITYTKSSVGITEVFRSVSRNVSQRRRNLKDDTSFEPEDREAQVKAANTPRV